MDKAKAVYSLIKEVSIKHNLYKISAESLKNYAKMKIGSEKIDLNLQDINEMDTLLKELAQKELIGLEYIDNMLHKVIFKGYFMERIRSAYSAMEKDPHIPFPIPEMFKQTIPTDLIQVVDVKAEFVTHLENPAPTDAKILRLVFPQFEYSLLVLPSMLQTTLLHRAMSKVKTFLDKESNNDYIRSRLIAAMKKDEASVKNLMQRLHNNMQESLQTMMNPTTVSFSFWSHLASSVIKEYQSKKSFYAGDYVYAQAAFLIGYYNVYYKGKTQRNADKEAAHRYLKTRLKKEPYCYSLKDIYAFVGENGTELIKICGKEDYSNYINKLITELDSSGIPELIMVKTEAGRDYFISRDVFVQYFLREVDEASRFFKNEIVMEWKEALEAYTKVEDMKSEGAFEKLLIKKLRSQRPILMGMLDFKMLSLLSTNDRIGAESKLELERMIDPVNRHLMSYSRILKLDRNSLISEVKLLVPMYKSSGFFRGLVTAFGKLFGVFSSTKRKKKKKESKKGKDLEFTKTSSDDFSQAITRLRDEFVGEGGDIELSMDELIAKWNPLYDAVAKANLVEDVNSLIRDYIRKIKHSFSVSMPSKDRVESMAQRLSENKAFDAIKHREALRSYMVLYMIDQLGRMHLFK